MSTGDGSSKGAMVAPPRKIVGLLADASRIRNGVYVIIAYVMKKVKGRANCRGGEGE